MVKKILFIFLVHVIVLGSLWIWRDNKDDNGSGRIQDKYLLQDSIHVQIRKADSSDVEMLLCVNPDKLAEALTEQRFDISVLAHAAGESDWSLEKLDKDAARECYQIKVGQSDCEFMPAAGIYE